MIRIAISQAAFDAIAGTLPLGSVGYENATRRTIRVAGLTVVDRVAPVRPEHLTKHPNHDRLTA
jgi:hypothetical protein